MAGTSVGVELPDIKVLRGFAREQLAALLDSVKDIDVIFIVDCDVYS
jgi:hypothetical protein